MSKLEVQNGLIRGLPLALLITLVVQGAMAVWWVSAKARDADFLQQRVTKIETSIGKAEEFQEKVMEKLGRLDERVSAQNVLLDRIEKRMR
ncbi:MAG: hypothetical protein EOM37_04785 [Proteobacteria bacterium]|jgi:hypothetical protein|nr:hypothetical protein [Alphaproteobacteria bacterium]NCC03348.1 hypothetical protein [Pseudomonadota bacterium]